MSDALPEGFALVASALPVEAAVALREFCPDASGRGGVRNALRIEAFAAVAGSAAVRALVDPILGAAAVPVRATLFDKTPEANWKVPWHQDLAIAVAERIETAGFGAWTVKDGVAHVQPPARILEQMLAVRIHLDDCGPDNGPLRVLPRTHSLGRLTDAQIDEAAATLRQVECTVGAGGAVLMRPLLLHASSAARVATHRRVLHIDYACCNLPNGLRWLV